MAPRNEAATVSGFTAMVRERREHTGINTSNLARAALTTAQTIKNVEGGRTNPGLAVFTRLVAALGGEVRIVWRPVGGRPAKGKSMLVVGTAMVRKRWRRRR